MIGESVGIVDARQMIDERVNIGDSISSHNDQLSLLFGTVFVEKVALLHDPTTIADSDDLNQHRYFDCLRVRTCGSN